MKFTWYNPGEWNTLCDICGFKFKASQLKLRWDGLMCCATDWEPRHPQELIRPIPDQMKLPWTRPEPADITTTPVCTPSGQQDIIGLGVIGCFVIGSGFDLGYRGIIDITHNG